MCSTSRSCAKSSSSGRGSSATTSSPSCWPIPKSWARIPSARRALQKSTPGATSYGSEACAEQWICVYPDMRRGETHPERAEPDRGVSEAIRGDLSPLITKRKRPPAEPSEAGRLGKCIDRRLRQILPGQAVPWEEKYFGWSERKGE